MALKTKELPGKEIQNHGILPDKVLHFHSELFVKKVFLFYKKYFASEDFISKQILLELFVCAWNTILQIFTKQFCDILSISFLLSPLKFIQ